MQIKSLGPIEDSKEKKEKSQAREVKQRKERNHEAGPARAVLIGTCLNGRKVKKV